MLVPHSLRLFIRLPIGCSRPGLAWVGYVLVNFLLLLHLLSPSVSFPPSPLLLFYLSFFIPLSLLLSITHAPPTFPPSDDKFLRDTGGWWSRPANWRTNTSICVVAIGLATFGVWQASAKREVSRVIWLLRGGVNGINERGSEDGDKSFGEESWNYCQ